MLSCRNPKIVAAKPDLQGMHLGGTANDSGLMVRFIKDLWRDVCGGANPLGMYIFEGRQASCLQSRGAFGQLPFEV